MGPLKVFVDVSHSLRIFLAPLRFDVNLLHTTKIVCRILHPPPTFTSHNICPVVQRARVKDTVCNIQTIKVPHNSKLASDEWKMGIFRRANNL